MLKNKYFCKSNKLASNLLHFFLSKLVKTDVYRIFFKIPVCNILLPFRKSMCVISHPMEVSYVASCGTLVDLICCRILQTVVKTNIYNTILDLYYIVTFSPISVMSPAGNIAKSGCKAQAFIIFLYL